MKKRIIVLSVILLLALIATGCNKSSASSSSAESVAKDEYTIAVVVKIVGIPFFNVFENGVKRAASELGVNGYVTGPTEADPAQQVKIVEDLINSDVDAIVVVPNDAMALEPVLARARQKGIVVIANESPDQEGANADVEMIDNKKFAEGAAESLAKASGGSGGYVIYVGGLSVPLHNTWADIARDYLASNYPNLKEVTDRIPCGEDAELAYTRTRELLTTYPDLTGILGFGSLGPIGAAQALKERNLVGKIAVVGNVTPEMAAPYLKEGSITEGYLWNPADSGYASVFAAKYLLENQSINGIDIPGIGKPAITGNTLAFDATLVITADNALSLGF